MIRKSRFSVSTRRAGALAGTLALGLTTLTIAHARGPDFPISLAEAQERAEARFRELDSDANGELSSEELAAAPRRMQRAFQQGLHRQLQRADGERPKQDPEARRQLDQETFARLDADGDGLLSRDEFDPAKLRAAQGDEMQERLFARLDADGSGGLSREELPDPIERLAAMDTDGDGMVTRAEAREHRKERHDMHRGWRHGSQG